MAVELLCLVAPDFALQVMRRGRGGLCVLATRADAGARVIGVDAELAAVGVAVGQTVAQARSRVCLVEGRLGRGRVELDVLVVEPAVVARAFEEVLEELHLVAPGLHVESVGVVFVDPCDLAWLEPDVERLGGRMVAVLERRGYRAVAGVGGGRLVARLVALGSGGGVGRCRDGAAFLAPLGLGVVELDGRTREAMGMVGLRTLGDLARLSERQVVDRWGAGAVEAWRAARGEDAWAGVRWRPAVVHEAVVDVGGAVDVDGVGFALVGVVDRLVAEVRRSGQRPESLVVDLEAEGGAVRRVVVHLDRRVDVPAGASLVALLRLELERGVFEAGAVGVSRARVVFGRAPVEVGGVGDLSGVFGSEVGSEDLFVRRQGGEPIGVTLARLRARLGSEGVGRAELRSAVRPERAWRWRGLGEVEGDGQGGWGTAREVARPDVLDLLPLPPGTALRLVGGGPREIGEPAADRRLFGPCTLSGEWWDEEFVRDYYLVAEGGGRRIVFFDRLEGRWYWQGDVD